MGLFSNRTGSTAASKKAEPTHAVEQPTAGQPTKGRATPTRREAEAARMARLHPELDPKKAKQVAREARASERTRQMARFEALPERQLVRNVVDSRFNLGEIALPLLLMLVMASFLPGMIQHAQWVLIAMYVVIALLVVDTFLMWRRFKHLHAERMPDRPKRGLLMYAWNRAMSFRAWRQPRPVVKRGDAI